MGKALAIAISGLLLAPPGHSTKANPFAYKFEMTPEEGPVDPAIEKHYTATFNRCQKAAIATQANVACFEDEFARQDKTLNRVWQATFARSTPGMRGRLRAAQRQWFARRDPFCKSKSDEFGRGTIEPVVYVNCRVEQTMRRTMWLRALQ
ncbi:MAG: lysozyme inhibitor LprI family protein [Sphingomicrobium sp.]|nr:DUF1311 domain-containing protein [Sphingomonadales bacterium]